MAKIGLEEKLWQAVDKLRGSMDAAEYKNVALGIIFLKYVSNSFEEKYEEDKDEYLAENIFWVSKE
ncbi:type I restriction-modification system subunit M N-terminal domain-containing protein [Staphylococcus xylosus]|nr:type I restriction-modification system subunit M N-terminal domain-containing protein [Staphylococcus xylosus]MCA2503634.1 type I restriction-modification system subunit M N-terminal domain-containing protein [Staphylococcus xylosus]OEK84095.1 type I restriction endonuclease subunit M [Staphylococcus xylosus]